MHRRHTLYARHTQRRPSYTSCTASQPAARTSLWQTIDRRQRAPVPERAHCTPRCDPLPWRLQDAGRHAAPTTERTISAGDRHCQ
jgi:hypothetical protein